MTFWASLVFALVSAAPYLAAGIIVVGLMLWFSKASDPNEPPRDGPTG